MQMLFLSMIMMTINFDCNVITQEMEEDIYLEDSGYEDYQLDILGSFSHTRLGRQLT